jgi:hypothetical protein
MAESTRRGLRRTQLDSLVLRADQFVLDPLENNAFFGNAAERQKYSSSVRPMNQPMAI